MFENGLVIGKFHPLHAGHRFLLSVARSHSRFLDIIVCDGAGQEIPAEIRAGWAGTFFQADPQVRIHILKVDFDPASSKKWAENVLRILPVSPDCMFTSEADTGPKYAAMLGAEHHLVDAVRSRYPVSGSEIHANPKSYKNYLHPNVWAWYESPRTS